MFLHKTPGMAAGAVGGKNAPEPPVRNAASKSPPQAPAPQAPASPAAPRSASALIAAAGLPADKLSASLVSFARFFSLPLKPELMAAMRRQAFAASPAATTQAEPPAAKNAADTEAAAKSREALSLAAAAAESKGVELHPKGLEAFAEAIDPDWQKRQDSGGRDQRGRQNRRHDEREEENAPPKTGPITAADLKQIALDAAEKNPLLAILNRLPGKSGGRWIVLPFSFCEGGREFKVSLRILLETDQATNRAVCMATTKVAATLVALDIAEAGRQWLFVLETAKTTQSTNVDRLFINRLTVYHQPELPPKAHPPLVRELSRLMGIPPERVSVRSRAEPFPCEAGGADDLWRPVNEAV